MDRQIWIAICHCKTCYLTCLWSKFTRFLLLSTKMTTTKNNHSSVLKEKKTQRKKIERKKDVLSKAVAYSLFWLVYLCSPIKTYQQMSQMYLFEWIIRFEIWKYLLLQYVDVFNLTFWNKTSLLGKNICILVL